MYVTDSRVQYRFDGICNTLSGAVDASFENHGIYRGVIFHYCKKTEYFSFFAAGILAF